MSKKGETQRGRKRKTPTRTKDQQFVADNMSQLLSVIINEVPLWKCTSIATGHGIYPTLPDDCQCIRIPYENYVFMIHRLGESFVLTAFAKMPMKESTDFLLKETGVGARHGGTKCRSLSTAIGRDIKAMDAEYADGGIFVTPAVMGFMGKCKAFKPYKDVSDLRDGLVMANVGHMGEHQVFRVSGMVCDDPDYRTPELYWLCPLFGASFNKTYKDNGVEKNNSVYGMFDDLFFELFTIESTEWVHNSGIDEIAETDGEVAVATEQEGDVGYDFVIGDRIKVLLKDDASLSEEESDEQNTVFTKDQVGAMDPMLHTVIANNNINSWLIIPKENRPEYLRSVDSMVATAVGDIVVTISAMDTGDETIFILTEMTQKLEKRRCRVFHEADFANWSLCRVRMKRIAELAMNLIR